VPGAPPAHLGRAGAARPSSPSRSLALPSPSTRASGSTTTTERGRAPAKMAATRRVRERRTSASTLPGAVASEGAPLRRSGLPGWSAAASPPEHNPARSAADAPPLASTRPPQRCPYPGRLGPSTEPLGGTDPGPHGTRFVPGVKVAPPYRGVPKRHAGLRGTNGCDGRTDGHQTAGHRTGWTPDGLDTRQPDRGTGDKGARCPDTGRLDTGRLDTWTPDDGTDWWTPNGGRGRRRTAWQASWHPTSATTPLPLWCGLEVLPSRRRLGRSATGTAQQKRHCQGPGHRRDQTAAG
jgi:hypothetical protein